MAPMMSSPSVETEGKKVSTSFHLSDHKRDTARIWQAVVQDAGVDDKVLAADCGMSPGYYSKVASGHGDLFALVTRLPRKWAGLRGEFYARLAEEEGLDRRTRAAVRLALAAIEFLRAHRASPLKATLRSGASTAEGGSR